MPIGINVSRIDKDADSKESTELSFSGDFYMHSIAQTNILNGKENHFIGYAPIIFTYYTNSGSDESRLYHSIGIGSDINTVNVDVFGDADVVRYYLLYQRI